MCYPHYYIYGKNHLYVHSQYAYLSAAMSYQSSRLRYHLQTDPRTTCLSKKTRDTSTQSDYFTCIVCAHARTHILYVCIYIYTYIIRYIEHIHIHMLACMHTTYLHVYIYIYTHVIKHVLHLNMHVSKIYYTSCINIYITA